jgi:DNA-binding MltR family transcriptional regulator
MSFSDEALNRSLALVSEIEEQSDRGVAIVGLAWVEEALLEALESFLVDDKKARDRLFGRSGPLSSLSAKIDLARLLGMTTKVISSDMHTMREIRNEFAHSVLAKDDSALTFSTPHIKDKCLSLKCVAHEAISVPRTAFVRACAVLNSDFYIHKFVGQRIPDGANIFARMEHYA